MSDRTYNFKPFDSVFQLNRECFAPLKNTFAPLVTQQEGVKCSLLRGGTVYGYDGNTIKPNDRFSDVDITVVRPNVRGNRRIYEFDKIVEDAPEKLHIEVTEIDEETILSQAENPEIYGYDLLWEFSLDGFCLSGDELYRYLREKALRAFFLVGLSLCHEEIEYITASGVMKLICDGQLAYDVMRAWSIRNGYVTSPWKDRNVKLYLEDVEEMMTNKFSYNHLVGDKIVYRLPSSLVIKGLTYKKMARKMYKVYWRRFIRRLISRPIVSLFDLRRAISRIPFIVKVMVFGWKKLDSLLEMKYSRYMS